MNYEMTLRKGVFDIHKLKRRNSMRTKITLLALALALGMSQAKPTYAAFPNASVYVVHGIDGTDLGLAKPLPVDIFVNGAPTPVKNFTYASVAGPLDLPSGKYEIEVRLSDPSLSSIVAISARVDLAVGENASILAHLSEEGVPKLTKFINDVRNTETSGNARLVVRHGAAAPAVDVNLSSDPPVRFSSLRALKNSEQQGAELRAGDYRITVTPPFSFFKRIAGPIPFTLESSMAYFAYAVGSVRNNSFNLVVQSIQLN
jgi:hypothetical protein